MSNAGSPQPRALGFNPVKPVHYCVTGWRPKSTKIIRQMFVVFSSVGTYCTQ